MKQLLLLMTTASYRAGAFVEAAGRIGAPVVVGTDRPQALSALRPDAHLTLDFLVPERSLPTLRDFAAGHSIGAVIAAEDEGVRLGAVAAAALGLRHSPVAAVTAASDKLETRKTLFAAGLPSPAFRRVSRWVDPERLAAQLDYPCVLKPVALSASRGVIRADNPRQFVTAFHRVVKILAGTRGGMLVESYLPGVEVALEGLLTDGRLRPLALFDKPDPLEGPHFEETLYVTPSRLERSVQEAVVAMVARGTAAIGLTHGPVHAELRINDRGPWILEIAPRSIGGLCSRALRFGRGVSLEELILRHALGLDVDSLEREPAASGVMMVPIPSSGILTEVGGEEQARAVPAIEEVRITIPVGQELVPWPEGNRYLGFLFARAGTPDEVERALREAHRRLRFVVAPVGANQERAGSGRLRG